MAKPLTAPTPPEAPAAPQVSIGDRLQSVQNRIAEIESLNSKKAAKSTDSATTSPEPKTQSPAANRKVTSPESMARDAVANGSGPLTKRISEKNDTVSAPQKQSVITPPANSAVLSDNGQTSFERGRAVLNEFKELDKQEKVSSTSTSNAPAFIPSNSSNQHGIGYWLFTLLAIGLLAFVFVKSFLLNKNKTSDDIAETISNLNSNKFVSPESVSNNYKSPKIIKKPLPKPNDDNSKHFEVRI